MVFLSLYFYIFVFILLAIYYFFPVSKRWMILLIGSLAFYYKITEKGFFLFLSTIFISYFMGQMIAETKKEKKRKILTAGSIIAVVIPLLLIKEGNFITDGVLGKFTIDYIAPLGISFYTLQIIAYLYDVYSRKIIPEKSLAKYTLFVSYFPQIIQGPIPRYGQLSRELFQDNRFDENKFVKGFHLVIWGFFLKFMIADKAAIVVNTVFNSFETYKGSYVLVAGILYSIQLYADFQACVSMAQGVSGMFGIELVNNFHHPYFSRSIKEFWNRWHISLSTWLKDYIYIPLGGNRKGKLRKWFNIIIVFLISGMWHGAGDKYIFWGFLHAFYQIAGEMTAGVREYFYKWIRLERDSILGKIIQTSVTFLLVMFAWIIFRANSLQEGIAMLTSIFEVYNPWVLFSDRIFLLGLDIKECFVLLLSILVLIKVSCLQEKLEIRNWILQQHVILRWLIYIGAIEIIVIYGTYGFGFNAQDFIYGGF